MIVPWGDTCWPSLTYSQVLSFRAHYRKLALIPITTPLHSISVTRARVDAPIHDCLRRRWPPNVWELKFIPSSCLSFLSYSSRRGSSLKWLWRYVRNWNCVSRYWLHVSPDFVPCEFSSLFLGVISHPTIDRLHYSAFCRLKYPLCTAVHIPKYAVEGNI